MGPLVKSIASNDPERGANDWRLLLTIYQNKK